MPLSNKEKIMKLKKLNSFKVKVPSKSLNEGFLRATATAFSAQLDPTVDEISDIKTAISEAVTNCIVHAYKDTIGTITLTGEILIKIIAFFVRLVYNR